MKAVIYHADSHFAWGGEVGDVYKSLCKQFKKQCNEHGMPLIHLTCEGHEGWGDENHFYKLDPKNIVFNREEAFTDFLSKAPDDWYWFAEPDFQIIKMFKQPKGCDAVFLYRHGDGVPMTPSFRIAKPSALPVFTALREQMRAKKNFDWHGDSVAFTKVWHRMGRPQTGKVTYLDCLIDMRPFADYVKPGKFTRNLMGKRKLDHV